MKIISAIVLIVGVFLVATALFAGYANSITAHSGFRMDECGWTLLGIGVLCIGGAIGEQRYAIRKIANRHRNSWHRGKAPAHRHI